MMRYKHTEEQLNTHIGQLMGMKKDSFEYHNRRTNKDAVVVTVGDILEVAPMEGDLIYAIGHCGYNRISRLLQGLIDIGVYDYAVQEVEKTEEHIMNIYKSYDERPEFAKFLAWRMHNLALNFENEVIKKGDSNA